LREHRHELFDEAFQTELAGTYVDSVKGWPPVAPALLAAATILPSIPRPGGDPVCPRDLQGRVELAVAALGYSWVASTAMKPILDTLRPGAGRPADDQAYLMRSTLDDPDLAGANLVLEAASPEPCVIGRAADG